MIWMGPAIGAAAVALIVERFAGYPLWLHRRIGHPVEWMGKLIDWLEVRLNEPEAPPMISRLRGAAALLILLGITLAGAILTRTLVNDLPAAWLWEALLATPFIAQRSLRDHVKAVLSALESSIAQGRIAVGKIVGRDPASLDESGIAKAALESLAENTSDGVVAPIVWFAIAGLPGLAAYKAINTADSMIGHKSPRFRDFGWTAAKLDDVVNLPCSRLTGLLFAAAAALGNRDGGHAALTAMRRDAAKHMSPNAGWPEASLAGALGIRLGGPRSYDGHTVDLATMGEGRSRLEANDVRRGLRLYARALTLLALSIGAIAIVF